MSIFGDRTREARRRKDWSQRQLAEKVGVSEDTVGAWETRDVVPREPVQRTAAQVLEVPFEWLTGEAETIVVGKPIPVTVSEDRRFYRYTTGKRLPPKAYELMYSYIDKLEAAGFDGDEINEAEQFLFNGAFNKINARDPSEKSEDDLLLDIKAAWQFVRDVAARSGRKL